MDLTLSIVFFFSAFVSLGINLSQDLETCWKIANLSSEILSLAMGASGFRTFWFPWAQTCKMNYSIQIFTKKYYLLSKFSKLHNLETHFCELLRPRAPPFQKIKWNPWNLVTTLQKSCFLGPTIFKIPQPNWYYSTSPLSLSHLAVNNRAILSRWHEICFCLFSTSQ